MPAHSGQDEKLAELAVEIRYLTEGIRDVKDEVAEMRKVVTHLQVKTASHATMFGLAGGAITAFGSSIIKKVIGI